MLSLTEATPKEISNIYQLFENSIQKSLFHSEHWSEDQQANEPNNTMQLDESALIYYTEPTKAPPCNSEKHIQELDKTFGSSINEIREHLINQFGEFKQSKIVLFFLKHENHFKKYLPENRKQAIYSQFVAYCYLPETTPKDFSLTDREKELSKRVYETYQKSYHELKRVLDELKQALTTGGNQEIKIPKLKDNNSELKNKAENILKVLAGRWINNKIIMTDDQYKEIIESVFYLIDTGEILPPERQIKQEAPMQFIRKLFRELNTELYGKRINDNFIKFLHSYFECFNGSKETITNKHFNEYRNGIFDKDYNKVLQSIE